jgi:competence protein ComEA
VRGVGEASAGKFSAEGMTVNGRGFRASAAAPTQAAASAPKK